MVQITDPRDSLIAKLGRFIDDTQLSYLTQKERALLAQIMVLEE